MAAGFILDLVADTLNLKNLKPDVPEEFRDVYSSENYRRSQEYTRTKTKFSNVAALVNLVLTVGFWQAGGFNYADTLVSGWTDNAIIRGILFTAILTFLSSLVSLPFDIYSTFVTEEKYGFNKTTPKVFVADYAKSLALSVIIGVPLIALVLYIFQSAGDYAWLIGFGAVTVFSLFLQLLYPRFIMPLFNKFVPLKNEELRTAINDYARSVNFPLSNIYEMDGSRRSAKSNAFFTGFGRFKKIALFDTLIEKHTVKELVAILAHEIGHYKKKHIMTGTIFSVLHSGVVFWLLSVFLSHKGLYDAFYMDKPEVYSGMVFFALLYGPVEVILGLLLNIVSRSNERAADKFAAETTGDPDSMIAALKKLSEHNLSNLTPHKFYVFVNYSHPPLAERIENIRKLKP